MIKKARVFTDIHEDAVRPSLYEDDIWIDDGAGGLHTKLAAINGWAGLPSNIRPGWASRSANTGGKIDIGTDTINFSRSFVYGKNVYWLNGNDRLKKYDGEVVTNVSSAISNAQSLGSYNELNFVIGADAGAVHVSDDGGSTFTAVTTITDGGSIRAVYQGNGFILAGAENGIWKSSDGGNSWTQAQAYTGRMLNIREFDGEIWAVGDDGTDNLIYKSVDNGETWSLINNDPSGLSAWDIAVNGSDVWVLLQSELWYSNDGGSSFTKRSLPADTTAISLIEINGKVYVSDRRLDNLNGYLAFTEDNGQTWVNVVNGVGGRIIQLSPYSSGVISGGEQVGIYDIAALTVGNDSCRRSMWFYMDYDTSVDEYSPNTIDGSNLNYLGVEFQNVTEPEGALDWVKLFLFTDSNGYPTPISYDLGGGSKQYIGWGCKISNNNNTGFSDQEIVLIEAINYPATPDDSNTILYDSLISLTSLTSLRGQFNAIRFLVASNSIHNVLLPSVNESPDYGSEIISEESVMPSSAVDTLFSNYWIEGGILGLGGSGSVGGAGLIDNVRLLSQ